MYKINSLTRRLPQHYLAGYFNANTKHKHAEDFGWPNYPVFEDLYALYKRNGIARALVQRPVQKTWQDNPWLLEGEPPHKETEAERRIRQRFEELQFWCKLASADEKSRVGEYAGIILRFADNKSFDQPVTTVPGGINGLVELIPVFEKQLEPSNWDTDPQSPNYGQPLMYQFNESAIPNHVDQPRSFMVHPDRVHIWSHDGSVNGASVLEAPLNALLDYEKVRGAGGAGFWKNSKNAPIFNATSDRGSVVQDTAAAMGLTVEEFMTKFSEQVEDFNRLFDSSLITQNMEATFPQVSMPDPEQFLMGPLKEAAASEMIPLKILMGSQSGERASTEDANEWAETNMARREHLAKPNIMRLINKLVRVGVLLARDYYLDWSDLTESSVDEKIARAEKMANINKALIGAGMEQLPFTTDEIREAVGYEPFKVERTVGEELPDDED